MAKRFKEKENSKKTIIVLVLLVLAFTLILGSSFALFSDYIFSSFSATAGTVKLNSSTILINSKEEPITNWKPGDVSTIEWTVENAGNKSIYTKHTLEIAWDVSEDLPELGIIYLYPNTMTDEEIRNDIVTNNGANAIKIGNNQNTIKTATNTTKGYIYQFLGNILDGIGEGAEIGDSAGGITSETLQFKLAFSLNTTIAFQNLPVYVNVITEALQYRNNPDGM